MLSTKKFFIPLLIALNIISISNITCMENIQTFDLDTYRCKSASVTAVYTHKNKRCVIATREAHGTSRGNYDDFSGGREKGETNPLTSAAREFWEEAMLQETLGWNIEDTENFIKENTLYVIAYTKDKNPHNSKSREVRNVTYIVNFNEYAALLFAKFYPGLDNEKKRYRKLGTPKRQQHTTEKDKIGTILWNNLKEASITNKKTIQAAVKDPQTKQFKKEQVTLRPFLTSKLRPFFLDMPYEQGENDNIRHYHARLREVYTFSSSSEECTCSVSEGI